MATVALVQLASEASEAPAARLHRALEMTREATQGADLVVLPELWISGAFDIDAARDLAEPLDGPIIRGFRQVAAERGTWIHAGSIPERTAMGQIFNTSVVIDDDGAIAAVYRKIHLFGFDEGEPTVMSAGTDLVVTRTPLGPTGIATCYDLRFPEQFRGLVDVGAQTFLLASGWPTPRIEHWRILLRARAIEDLAWVVACNGVGTHRGVTLGGHSAVIDPRGEVIAEAGGGEEILRAEVDPTAVIAWREAFPALADRV